MIKLSRWIYSIVFLVISFVPVLTMPLLIGEKKNEGENRVDTLPSFIEEGEINLSFFEEMDQYLNNNFTFRNEMININSKYMEEVWKTSAQPKVVVGEEGWLYFADTVDDFLGKNRLTPIELENIVKVINLVKEYLESKGVSFIFTIAPNKNSIYEQYMPVNYQKNSAKSNAEQLKMMIDETIYIDLFEVLRESEEITYLKRDSHWNDYGAYIAFQEILQGLGIKKQMFEILDSEIKADFEPDLEVMLYPQNAALDEQIYYQFNNEFEYTSRFKTMDDIKITTRNDNAEDSVFVFRDSFGNALLQFFGRQFEEVTFSRAIPYQIDQAAQSDYVVLEIVERNVGNLLKQAPIMPAPKRKLEQLNEIDNAVTTIEDKKDYKHIYGYIEEEYLNLGEEIYIVVENGETKNVYEAFPILEEKLGQMKDGNVGFSAYIPLEEIAENSKVFVACNNLDL